VDGLAIIHPFCEKLVDIPRKNAPFEISLGITFAQEALATLPHFNPAVM
jgi:hypothetical protein